MDMTKEFPITDPKLSISEVRKFARENYGGMKGLRDAFYIQMDSDACVALALYERATEALEIMKDNPDVTYGDKSLETLLDELVQGE